MLLSGKTAIISGASSGIGKAAAGLFAQEGANLILIARRAELLDQIVISIRAGGGKAIACPGDVTVEATHRRAVAMAHEYFGSLDIALNNAGIVGAFRPLADISAEEWAEVNNTNLTSAFLAVRQQIPAMIDNGGGAIVFTGSIVGSTAAVPGMSAYGVTKAGLAALAKGIAADYGPKGIRANVIVTGGVNTEMSGTQAQKAHIASYHALQRLADAQEIAQSALFLASDMASFIAGSEIPVDGGSSFVRF